VFVAVVCFVTDSVQKRLDTPSYSATSTIQITESRNR